MGEVVELEGGVYVRGKGRVGDKDHGAVVSGCQLLAPDTQLFQGDLQGAVAQVIGGDGEGVRYRPGQRGRCRWLSSGTELLSAAGDAGSTGCTGVALECWKKKQTSTSTASPPPSTMRQVDRGLWAGDAGAAEGPAGACSSRILWATSSGAAQLCYGAGPPFPARRHPDNLRSNSKRPCARPPAKEPEAAPAQQEMQYGS